MRIVKDKVLYTQKLSDFLDAFGWTGCLQVLCAKLCCYSLTHLPSCNRHLSPPHILLTRKMFRRSLQKEKYCALSYSSKHIHTYYILGKNRGEDSQLPINLIQTDCDAGDCHQSFTDLPPPGRAALD